MSCKRKSNRGATDQNIRLTVTTLKFIERNPFPCAIILIDTIAISCTSILSSFHEHNRVQHSTVPRILPADKCDSPVENKVGSYAAVFRAKLNSKCGLARKSPFRRRRATNRSHTQMNVCHQKHNHWNLHNLLTYGLSNHETGSN